MKTKTGIKVYDAMTKRPVTARPDDVVQKCAQKMLTNEVGSIVIEENGVLMGIISEKDIVEKVVAQCKDPSVVKARDIMSKNVVTIDPKKDIYDALLLMGHEEIRKLPVVDGKKFVGLLTAKDIIKIEPALFDIFYGRLEDLKEQEFKPLKYTYGSCDKCGSQGPVQNFRNKFYCNSCMPSLRNS